jgi:hypothetical protein
MAALRFLLSLLLLSCFFMIVNVLSPAVAFGDFIDIIQEPARNHAALSPASMHSRRVSHRRRVPRLS